MPKLKLVIVKNGDYYNIYNLFNSILRNFNSLILFKHYNLSMLQLCHKCILLKVNNYVEFKNSMSQSKSFKDQVYLSNFIKFFSTIVALVYNKFQKFIERKLTK